MSRFLSFAFLATLVLTLLVPDLAWAEARNWQLGFQEAATPVARELHDFHHFLLIIITGIVIFVFGLLFYVMLRFNSRANPVPSTTTHHVGLEILWTVVPVLILIMIAIPSFSLLYYMDRTKNPEMTLKITGYQWYWGYEYPDHGGLSFTANQVKTEDIDSTKKQIRQLSTDHPVVLPIDTDIQILVTAADVLHSFAMPSFGVKIDAVPGRTNETWTRIEKPGVYYGQCSELCGTGHAFMPIEIHAVSKEEFAEWVVAQGGTMPPVPEPVILGGDAPPEATAEPDAAAKK
jgi:cytochrome c oxidase subunit 2